MNDASRHCHCGNESTGQVCPNCSSEFVCGLAQGCDRCWCMDLPAVMPVHGATSCLCEQCLREAIDRVQSGVSAESLQDRPSQIGQ